MQDINECLRDNGGCDQDAQCINFDGGFRCLCDAGFSGDGYSCQVRVTALVNNILKILTLISIFRILTSVPRTRHSVLTGSVVTTRAPSGASVRWASRLPAPGTRRTVLTLMSVRSSPTSVSTGPVRIRTGCSNVSVTRDTN